ncbi:hypothetical protein BC834DRAFT_974433 [Gloeopeniophorella convolvens]|nr:hypothetical protein BC834DRAFT_974433 [Gloeopeniophorella convolvens]
MRPTAQSFTLRLGQAVDFGRTVQLLEILKEMKDLGIKPDILTYNSAMELLARHAMEAEAWAVLDDMKAVGVAPDVETYKFLLRAVRRSPHQATWAVIDLMDQAGVARNEGVYALHIQRYLNDENFEMAFKLLVEMEGRGYTPTLNTAEAVITAAAQKKMPRLAWELAENFEATSVRRISPRVWAACLLASSELLYKDGVVHLWRKLTEELKILPDEGCCIEVLHTAGRHGLPELAMDVLRVLKSIGAELKDYHFAPIVEALCRSGDIKEALGLLTVMRQHKIEPDSGTAHPIFNAIRTGTDAVDKAWDAVEALHADGQTVDITAVNVIIQASVALGDLQRAFGTYQTCGQLGVKPTLDTFHYLLSGCISAKHRELGDRLVAEMKEAKIKPDAGTYERLIVLCLTGETYEDAFFYLEEMKAENLYPPLSVYEAIIRRCVMEKDSRYAVAVQELGEFGYSVSPALQKVISGEGEGSRPRRRP